MRKCPFANCPEDVPDHVFACRPHWMSLSVVDKRRIHAAYSDYLDDKIGMDELRRIQQDVLGTRGTA